MAPAPATSFERIDDPATYAAWHETKLHCYGQAEISGRAVFALRLSNVEGASRRIGGLGLYQ